jgi:hypothetical protein
MMVKVWAKANGINSAPQVLFIRIFAKASLPSSAGATPS